MEKTLSPIYYVSVEENNQCVEIQHFDEMEKALGLAMSMHQICQKKVSIFVSNQKETILSLRSRKEPHPCQKPQAS